MSTWHPIALGFLLLLGSAPARALEGAVLINHDRVIAAGGYPFTITAPGSYRLAGNLDVTGAADPPNTTAISVNASGPVHIDLNGFSIVGPGTPGTGRGIDFVSGSGHSVRDGIVRGMGDSGILSGSNTLVEYVTAVDNGLNGIFVGSRSSIRHCRAARNGNTGLAVDQFATVEDSLSQGNADFGIHSSQKGTVYRGSIAWQNGNGGFYASDTAVVEGNIARNNGTNGVRTWNNSVVSSNVSGFNGGDGFLGGGQTSYRHNVSFNNTDNGIQGGNYLVITGNVMFENGNDGLGFKALTNGVGLNTFSYNDQDGNGDINEGSLSGFFFSVLQSNYCEPGTCVIAE
jgi:hypothetical protein